jgi:KaiC domain protein
VQVRINMSQFGWDVRKYEKDGLFVIVDAFTGGIGEAAKREKYVVGDVDNIDEFLDVLRNAIKETNAQRIAVDSVSTLYLAKPAMARKIVMSLKRVLAGLGLTGILVSQVSVTEKGFGGPGVEHAADGIIRLDLDEVDGQLIRSLIVWKMRGTSHSLKRHRFDITDKGIVVYPDKIVKLGRMVRVEERVEG